MKNPFLIVFNSIDLSWINRGNMQLTIIQQRIYEIRGQKVMLDFDLADLYKVETKRLKEAVRRNKSRFPADFMFSLNKKEWADLRTQIATSRWGGTRYLPFAFTEQGVAMLSGVLNSGRAVKMHLSIMRAFVEIRRFILNYKELAEEIKEIKKTVRNHNDQLGQIYNAIENLLDEKEEKKSWDQRERIGFKTPRK